MKTKMKLTDKYLASLPAELVAGIEHDLKDAEIEPYIKRAGYAGLEISENEERVSIARMSTRDIDSDGEIVMPYALDISRYQANPVVLLNHSWGEPPIGSASDIVLTDKGIDGKIAYADTPRGNEIWSLVRDKHMRANSIGFIITDYVGRSHKDFSKLVDKALQEWDEFTRRHAEQLRGFIRRGILLENSVVTIPANAHALMEAVATRGMSLSPEMINMLHLDIESASDGEQEEVDEAKSNETITITVDGEEFVEIPLDELDDLESVEVTTVEADAEPEGDIPQVGDPHPDAPAPETVEEAIESAKPKARLVARLVKRAPQKKTAIDPRVIQRAAADEIDLKMGKI